MAARKKATKKKAAKAAKAKTARKGAAKRSAKPARAKAKRGFHLAKLAPSLTVDDLAKSLKYYTETLGFTITQRWENEGRLLGAELAAGDVDVYLSQEDGGKGPRLKGQGFRLYWYTNQNIDQIADGIKARGGMLASEPKDEWGVRAFSIVDPTGYLITISSER
jgi:uncharacterized glyoxalase superfamily protein PhnB